MLRDGAIESEISADDTVVACDVPKRPVWRELHARLQGIAKRRAALDADEAACLVRAEAIGLWRRLGYCHMGEYMERELGYAPKAGMDRLRVARALVELPLTAACMADGLHYSSVRELTRVATPGTERAWLDFARGKNLRQIEAAVSGRKKGDLPTDPTDPDLRKQVVRYELSPHVVALLRQATAAIRQDVGHEVDDDVVIEALCRRALGAGAETNKPAYRVAVTVCEQCERGWQTAAGRDIEISAAAIERARCDAEEIGSLEADKPARTKSTVPPRTRKHVLARDKHCTVPGCRSAANIDVHHIKLRKDGGGHQTWNLTTVCSGHHHLLHDGLLVMTGRAPDAIELRWAEPPPESTAGTLVEAGARSALVTLGFRPADARDAVAMARPHVGTPSRLEDLIREALRRCARSARTE